MKISVIIAIVHMCVGVFLKLINALYFKRTLEIVFEFIPQILFLGLLFGYMDFLVIFKWLKDWHCRPNAEGTTMVCITDHEPPSIISTMMDIGLQMGSTVLLLIYSKKLELCGKMQETHLKIPSKYSSLA